MCIQKAYPTRGEEGGEGGGHLAVVPSLHMQIPSAFGLARGLHKGRPESRSLYFLPSFFAPETPPLRNGTQPAAACLPRVRFSLSRTAAFSRVEGTRSERCGATCRNIPMQSSDAGFRPQRREEECASFMAERVLEAITFCERVLAFTLNSV